MNTAVASVATVTSSHHAIRPPRPTRQYNTTATSSHPGSPLCNSVGCQVARAWPTAARTAATAKQAVASLRQAAPGRHGNGSDYMLRSLAVQAGAVQRRR